MKNKLNEIIENKRKEVEKKKEKRDFLGSITNPKTGDISILAEIKLASPTAGKLGDINELEERVFMYEKSSADCCRYHCRYNFLLFCKNKSIL